MSSLNAWSPSDSLKKTSKVSSTNTEYAYSTLDHLKASSITNSIWSRSQSFSFIMTMKRQMRSSKLLMRSQVSSATATSLSLSFLRSTWTSTSHATYSQSTSIQVFILSSRRRMERWLPSKFWQTTKRTCFTRSILTLKSWAKSTMIRCTMKLWVHQVKNLPSTILLHLLLERNALWEGHRQSQGIIHKVLR